MSYKVQEAVATAPPVAASGFIVAGLPLDQWVVVLTGLYLVLQILWFVYTKWKAIQNGGIGE